ncbi:M23 family metallopeptidase [Actinoplanes oblitus]|uniref:M23 family metallopeptidase n=1 Tax=Actinoplanes oblitus TaxID=3040509 RepID=A0ABY8W571_9ACTN|nr:M23 family metallopeptidase [Actinoplanes oblitus]WIM92994.1 M23 family metallopeptidase [Actinoplanes oblitus]
MLAVAAVATAVAVPRAEAATKAYYLPFPAGVSYRVTQGWDGSFSHNGSEYVRYAVDFAMPSGSTVVASAPGVVYASYYSADSWGNTVVIKHPWGECTRYSHLSSRKVVEGQSVTQAQIVGISGATGNVSGAHLDFKAENCGNRYSIKMAFQEYGGSLYDSAVQGKTLTSRNSPAKPVDTVGMWNAAGHSFHLLGANAAGNSTWAFTYGAVGDLPVTGDWDGNGKDSVGVFRPGTDSGTFHLSNDLTSGTSDYAFASGLPTDLPLAGDWNGDGKDSVGIYRPSDGTFHLRDALSEGSSTYAFSFGPDNTNLIPLAGDWNGDGKDSVGYYDPATSRFTLTNTLGGGDADYTYVYGRAGDQPVIGDWDGNGTDTPGLYRPDTTQFLLKNSHGAGNATITFTGFSAGMTPVAGDWDDR